MTDTCSYCHEMTEIALVLDEIKMCHSCQSDPMRTLERQCREMAEDTGRPNGLTEAQIDQLAKDTFEYAKKTMPRS
jgi:hypothetical protein